MSAVKLTQSSLKDFTNLSAWTKSPLKFLKLASSAVKPNFLANSIPSLIRSLIFFCSSGVILYYMDINIEKAKF